MHMANRKPAKFTGTEAHKTTNSEIHTQYLSAGYKSLLAFNFSSELESVWECVCVCMWKRDQS